MNDKLRKNVQEFLLDYEERVFMLALLNGTKIEHSLSDDLKTTNSLLETSVDLLRKCVVDDYKIIPDYNIEQVVDDYQIVPDKIAPQDGDN